MTGKLLRLFEKPRPKQFALGSQLLRYLSLRSRIEKLGREHNFDKLTGLEVFRKIYLQNLWENPESRSGWGSMIEGVNGTSRIRKVLPIILEALHITSFVDAPCGDFNWMQKVNLTGTSYLGIDVVPELVAQNQRLYHSKDINFMQGDLLSDKIPKCDLIMVRDLLIHHSNRSAIKILENIIQSDVFYLLVSNYSGVKRNLNTFSGGLRLYNLYEKPFSSVKLPHPLLRFTDGDGAYGREMVLLELK